MGKSAQDLLLEMIEAIEASRDPEGRNRFYPELVFEKLRDGWLKNAKDAVGYEAGQ